MSLGGIAIAIGAMVDAVIIMIENAHKHIERDGGKKPHWEIIRDASIEVGPTLFYSLLVITVSFIPVFTLAGAGRPAVQAARLHQDLLHGRGGPAFDHPRAGADGLSSSAEKFRRRKRTRSTAFSSGCIIRCIDFVIKWRWAVIVARGRRSSSGSSSHGTGSSPTVCRTVRPRTARFTDRQGHSPFNTSAPNSCRRSTKAICSTCRRRSPASRPTKAREILQQTDKIIKSFPEVHHVFGKIGRAETATDPAPIRHDRNDDHAQRREGLAGGRHQGRRRQSHRAPPAHARRTRRTP